MASHASISQGKGVQSLFFKMIFLGGVKLYCCVKSRVCIVEVVFGRYWLVTLSADWTCVSLSVSPVMKSATAQISPSNADATFVKSTRMQRFKKNTLMLVFIGKLSLSTL